MSDNTTEIFFFKESNSDLLFADEDSKIDPNFNSFIINVNNNLENTQLQENENQCSQINQLKGYDIDSFSLNSLSVFFKNKPSETKMKELLKNISYDIQNIFAQETISNEDNLSDAQIFFINNRIPKNKNNNNNTQKKILFKIALIPNLTPKQIDNYEPIVHEHFLKACNNNKKMTCYSIACYLNTKFRYSTRTNNTGLGELTPENYIQLVLKNAGRVYNQNIGLNVYRIILSCVREKDKLNEKEKKKENKEPSNFNNIKTNTIGILPEKNDLDKKNFININVNKNKRKKIDSTKFEVQEEKSTAENSNKENNLNQKKNVINRKDNLFERFKSIVVILLLMMLIVLLK